MAQTIVLGIAAMVGSIAIAIASGMISMKNILVIKTP